MNLRKSLLCLIVLTVFLLFLSISGKAAQGDFEIQIETEKKQIRYGDPIVLDITLEYEKPQISQRTGKLSKVTTLDEVSLSIKWTDANETRVIPFRLHVDFAMQDSKGLKYKKNAVLFCDLYEERRKYIKNFIFDRVGTCTLQVIRANNKSNAIELTVEPSELNEKALFILSEVQDLAFLIGGLFKDSNTVSKLEQVVQQCEGTTLANWSAARLGVEYFEEFNRQYYNSKELKAIRQKKSKGYPLFNKARIYLEKGSALPDGFPIRGEVLDKLMETEYINGNYQEAIRLAEELESKYPHSKYGKRASRAKKELRELEEAEKGKK